MNSNFCPICGGQVVAGQGCPNCMGQQNGMAMNNGQPMNMGNPQMNINGQSNGMMINNGQPMNMGNPQMNMNGQPNGMMMNNSQPMNMNVDPNMQIVPPMNNGAAAYDPNWKNTKAVWSLVLGILSFFVLGFLAFCGLAIGINALTEAKMHNGKGKGLAITSIVINSICSAIVLLNVILTLAGAV